MSIIQFIKSKKAYTLANLFFAGINSIVSVLVVKIFGIRLYGLFTYFNNIDSIIDYLSGHVRATFESTIPGTKNERKIIQSFAILQLILGIISMFFFFIFSLNSESKDSIRMSQIFILLSPGKSYIAFFRNFSKVTGELYYYTIAILFVSLINILLLIQSWFGLDFFNYLIFRTGTLIFICIVLFFCTKVFKNISFGIFKYAFFELYKKSGSIFLYSFSSLLYLVCDKILIGHFFGYELLGFYSISFMVYSFVQILCTSQLATDFRVLMVGDFNEYIVSLRDTIIVAIKFLFLLELLLSVVFRFPYFIVYKDALFYLYLIFPTSIAICFIEIAYLFLISKGLLKNVNLWFIITGISYLFLSILMSLYSNNVIWFSVLFVFHQFLLIYFLSKKYLFLRKVFKQVLISVKIYFLFFLLFHLVFIFLNTN
jgi:hypothetical protein